MLRAHRYGFLWIMALSTLLFFSQEEHGRVWAQAWEELAAPWLSGRDAAGVSEGDGAAISPGDADLADISAGDAAQSGSISGDGGAGSQSFGDAIPPGGLPGEEGVSSGDGGVSSGDGEQQAAPVWAFAPVEEAYYDQVAFIGDSRIDGLALYGGFAPEVAFYSGKGMTVFNMMEKNLTGLDLEGNRVKKALPEWLALRQFTAIYLMVGINEMGRGDVEGFVQAYQERIREIQALQPQAKVVIQAILRVSAERNAKGDYINNAAIEERNAALAQLADGQNIFFLDSNAVFADEDGNMRGDWTYDGVHLKASYLPRWKEFLLANGLVLQPASSPSS